MKCPCCGQPVEEVSLGSLVEANLTAVERRVVEVLIEAYPSRISLEHIIDALYVDDPNGGPLWARKNAHVMVHRLRKKLAEVGWSIPKVRGTGTSGRLYGLEQLK